MKPFRIFVADAPLTGVGKNWRLRKRLAEALQVNPDRVWVTDPKRANGKDWPA